MPATRVDDTASRNRLPSLETILLLLLGALDLMMLRELLPLPVWTVITNLFWLLAIVTMVFELAPFRWAWQKSVPTAAAISAIVLLAGVTTLSLIALRQTTAPHLFVHDNAILIEEGIKQLESGRNFYAADFRGTVLQDWQGGKFFDAQNQTWFDNPALDHYITLPFYTLASVPVAWISQQLIGWYDQRFIHLLIFVGLLAVAWQLPGRKSNRVAYLLVLALNPLTLSALVMGTSDIFVVGFLLLSVWLLAQQRPLWAAAALALAAASKQTAWLVIPFLVAYWYWHVRRRGLSPRQALLVSLRQLWPLPVVFAAFVLPFVVWDFRAFIDDVYRYPAGLLPTSYPIYGYGLSVLLQLFGFPASARAYFPYSLLQIAVAGPLLVVLLVWQRRHNTLAFAVGGGVIFLLVFWWLSRFFNENYLGVIVMLLATAYVLNAENPKPQAPTTINSKHQAPNPKQYPIAEIPISKRLEF